MHTLIVGAVWLLWRYIVDKQCGCDNEHLIFMQIDPLTSQSWHFVPVNKPCTISPLSHLQVMFLLYTLQTLLGPRHPYSITLYLRIRFKTMLSQPGKDNMYPSLMFVGTRNRAVLDQPDCKNHTGPCATYSYIGIGSCAILEQQS